jgi:hypothetical protein
MELGDRCAELENAGKTGSRKAIEARMAQFEAALTDVEAELAGLLTGR